MSALPAQPQENAEPQGDAERLAELNAIMQAVRDRVRARYPVPEAVSSAEPSDSNTRRPPIHVRIADLMPVVHARDAAMGKVAAIGSVNPRSGGILNRIIQWIKKTIARSLQWFVRDQITFNREAVSALEAIMEALNEQNRSLVSLAGQTNEQMGYAFAELAARAAELSAEINARAVELRAEINARAGELSAEINARAAELSGELNARAVELSGELNERAIELSAEFNARLVEVTDARAGELNAGFNARLVEVTDARAAELSAEINARAGELNAGFNARAGELNAGFNARLVEMTDARAGELSAEINARAAELSAEINARAEELNAGFNARLVEVSDTRAAELSAEINARAGELNAGFNARLVEVTDARAVELSAEINARAVELSTTMNRLAAETLRELRASTGELTAAYERLDPEIQELKDIRKHFVELRAAWENKVFTNEIQFLRTAADLQGAFQHRSTLMEANFREIAKAQHNDYLSALDRTTVDIQKRLWLDLQKVRAEYDRLIHDELRIIRLRQPSSAQSQPPPSAAPHDAAAHSAESTQPLDIDYTRFAFRFRGSEAQVRQTEELYRPFFADCRSVLDIGCGRGEFLQLMHEMGIPAKGIDLGAESVAMCRDKGLDAEVADLFTYPLLQIAGEFDGIFASQLVEHLDPARLPEMIRLCAGSLRRGGVLAIETPNPDCLAIFATYFYLDPTHTRPVPRQLLEFYMEESGIGSIEVHEISPAVESIPELAELPESLRKRFFGGLDYAIVGRKL